MKKIEIFVGSDSAFEKIVPKSARNLSEMAAKLDDGNKKMDVFVNIPGQPEPKLKKKKKPRVQDFVIHADEYCSVQEHVIINFINFIFQMSITNMYIQNPPKNIREQIYRTFDKSIIHETQGYSVIRLKPSRKDWNEILCDKNADRKKAIAETITIKVPETEELVPMLCYEDIEQTSVEWLWFPYIPFGKLTIVQGNPGEGKTYFAMMLTAACTNRKLFPNMEDIEPFNVIYQTAEDGMGDTIKPRLVEAGANLSKVMVIDDSEEALTLSDDRIEKAVRQNHVRLVIIDQVQAFIGADVDMNRANEVRPVFRKLGMIAEKTGCAIVLIGHLNKSSGTQSTYRGLGSIDIMAAVRSLIFIGKVRKDPTTRVLIHEKSSLAPPGETMAFKLGDEEGFRWVGAYEISADELLDGKEGKATETKLERGTKLIKELLADKKEISIRELDEKAKEQGISGRTMRDVRSRMKNELEYRVNEKQENSIRLKE